MHFVQIFNQKYQLTKRIAPEVIDLFMKYDWPGNVRELENLIERLVVITPGDVVNVQDLPVHITSEHPEALTDNLSQITVSGIVPLKDAVESVERQILQQAYAKYRIPVKWRPSSKSMPQLSCAKQPNTASPQGK